jgi:hypothetical protein
MRAKLLIVGGVALLLALIAFIGRRTPSGLYIHIQSIPCESVVVESANLSKPIRFTSTGTELIVTPIEHGVYRVGIRLQDGHTLWATFFHQDVGTRQRVDLFVSSSSRSGYVHFRQTANRTKELFAGEVRPEDATEEKPLQLDWI